jgi:hypothetical protein
MKKQTMQQYIDDSYNGYINAGLKISKQDVIDDTRQRLKATTNKYNIPNDPLYFTSFDTKGVTGMASVAHYAKPNQPYYYQPNDAKRSQVQGVQPTRFNGNIQPQITGMPQAGGPTQFSFTGTQNGQQKSLYFQDLDTWKAASDQLGYRHREVTNNGNEAHATGYEFEDGGTNPPSKPKPKYNIPNAYMFDRFHPEHTPTKQDSVDYKNTFEAAQKNPGQFNYQQLLQASMNDYLIHNELSPDQNRTNYLRDANKAAAVWDAQNPKFEEGGEYELTDIQIKQLRKQGYKIQIL